MKNNNNNKNIDTSVTTNNENGISKCDTSGDTFDIFFVQHFILILILVTFYF